MSTAVALKPGACVRHIVRGAPGAWRFPDEHPTYLQALAAGLEWLEDPEVCSERFWSAIEALSGPYDPCE